MKRKKKKKKQSSPGASGGGAENAPGKAQGDDAPQRSSGGMGTPPIFKAGGKATAASRTTSTTLGSLTEGRFADLPLSAPTQRAMAGGGVGVHVYVCV